MNTSLDENEANREGGAARALEIMNENKKLVDTEYEGTDQLAAAT
ncbi:MAG TPA: hypothetical protein VIW47_11890 [Nitrospiraceae bacterium]